MNAIVSYRHCLDEGEGSKLTSDLPESTAFHFGLMSNSLYLKYGKHFIVIPAPEYVHKIDALTVGSEVEFDIYPPKTVISMVQE